MLTMHHLWLLWVPLSCRGTCLHWLSDNPAVTVHYTLCGCAAAGWVLIVNVVCVATWNQECLLVHRRGHMSATDATSLGITFTRVRIPTSLWVNYLGSPLSCRFRELHLFIVHEWSCLVCEWIGTMFCRLWPPYHCLAWCFEAVKKFCRISTSAKKTETEMWREKMPAILSCFLWIWQIMPSVVVIVILVVVVVLKNHSNRSKGRKYWTLQLSLFWPYWTDHADRGRNTCSSSNSAYILRCSKRVEHTPLK